MDQARGLALINTAVFDARDVDFIVTTAAGCGAMLKDYGRVLAHDSRASAAARVSAKTRDVSEVLCETGFAPPVRPLRVGGEVAYHDACHLLHAARVAVPPRSVVEAATGKAPVDLGENSVCCGSAGSYNLDKPTLARVLGRRKAELARELGVSAVSGRKRRLHVAARAGFRGPWPASAGPPSRGASRGSICALGGSAVNSQTAGRRVYRPR
jgi:glycolate oxidase iron-sulfur subunit